VSSELSPKSSAAQLWAALLEQRTDNARLRNLASPERISANPERKERNSASPSEELRNSTVLDLMTENARARAHEAALLEELAAARGEETAAGIAGDAVAGKPALAQFRQKTWRKFSRAVTRLPLVLESKGWNYVRLVAATDLDADLYLLGVSEPAGPLIAQERDEIRRFIDHPARLANLCRPETWADALRADFLSNAARVYFRPSVPVIYERASEQGVLDRRVQGTVFK